MLCGNMLTKNFPNVQSINLEHSGAALAALFDIAVIKSDIQYVCGLLYTPTHTLKTVR